MFYVFDTNICRLAIEKYPAVVQRTEALPTADRVCTTLISFGESVGGWLPVCRRANAGEERAHYYGLLYEVFNFSDPIEFCGSASMAAERSGNQQVV